MKLAKSIWPKAFNFAFLLDCEKGLLGQSPSSEKVKKCPDVVTSLEQASSGVPEVLNYLRKIVRQYFCNVCDAGVYSYLCYTLSRA